MHFGKVTIPSLKYKKKYSPKELLSTKIILAQKKTQNYNSMLLRITKLSLKKLKVERISLLCLVLEFSMMMQTLSKIQMSSEHKQDFMLTLTYTKIGFLISKSQVTKSPILMTVQLCLENSLTEITDQQSQLKINSLQHVPNS